MLKYGLSAAALMLASPALAQPPQGGPTPPPEFIQAAQAFGQCIGSNLSSLAATVTPEAGASQAIAGCAAQKTALETRFEAWVSSASFPAEGREIARQQFRTQLGGAEAQIAATIRQQRAAPAPAPAQ